MIRSSLLSLLTVTVLAATVGVASAQSANTKQPKPKSNKEVEAVNAIFTAQDPDSRIAAAMKLVQDFADSDFRSTAFYMAAASYQQKGDLENTVVYAEKALEADPKNYGSMLMLATTLAQRTREFDLDKEEKLGRADKMANEALSLVKTAPKPNPQLPDDQWENAKKDFASQAYEALGMSAMVRKKYDVCAEQMTTAVNTAAMPDPATYVRLAGCQQNLKKYDEALASLDKALADPNASSAVKNAATNAKIEINKVKAAAPKQ